MKRQDIAGYHFLDCSHIFCNYNDFRDIELILVNIKWLYKYTPKFVELDRANINRY